jgi:hypothetical protein
VDRDEREGKTEVKRREQNLIVWVYVIDDTHASSQISSNSIGRFSCYSLTTHDERTDGRTDGQNENNSSHLRSGTKKMRCVAIERGATKHMLVETAY